MALVPNTYSPFLIEDILCQVLLRIDRHYSLDCWEDRVVWRLSLRRRRAASKPLYAYQSAGSWRRPPIINIKAGYLQDSERQPWPSESLFFRVSARSHDVKGSNGPLVRHPRLHGLAGYAIVTRRAARILPPLPGLQGFLRQPGYYLVQPYVLLLVHTPLFKLGGEMSCLPEF